MMDKFKNLVLSTRLTIPKADFDMFAVIAESRKTGINSKVQSNLSYVTFQGKAKLWSYKTGGLYIQVHFT